MAELRLIDPACQRSLARSISGALVMGVSALVSSACRSSEAGPTSGLVPPSGWQALPTLATAANDAAKAGGITIDGSEAWGEPARGCYAAWLALRGSGGAPEKMAEQLIASISAEPTLARITVRDVVKPVAGANAGVLALAFERAPYQGRVRTTLARDGQIGMLVCFWNSREPAACDAGCTQLIGSMR